MLDGEVEEKRFKYLHPEDEEAGDEAQALVVAATPPAVPGALGTQSPRCAAPPGLRAAQLTSPPPASGLCCCPFIRPFASRSHAPGAARRRPRVPEAVPPAPAGRSPRRCRPGERHLHQRCPRAPAQLLWEFRTLSWHHALPVATQGSVHTHPPPASHRRSLRASTPSGTTGTGPVPPGR